MLLHLPLSRKDATIVNTFKGSLRVTPYSPSYPSNLIKFFWCLMKRARHTFFLNLVYLSLLQLTAITAVSFRYIYIFKTQWFTSANLYLDYNSETMADLSTGHRQPFLIPLQLVFPDVRLLLGSGSRFSIILKKSDFYLLIAIIRAVIFLVFLFLIIILLLYFVIYNYILRLGPSMLRLFIR